jgi:hypothetical protein
MIRKRRGASSSQYTTSVEPTIATSVTEPLIQSGIESDYNDDDTSASAFAQNTLSPTFRGVLGKIIGRVIGALIGYYLIFEAWYESMALGLGRWIVGGTSGAREEESVKLVPQGNEKQVKRRRRHTAGGNVGGESAFPNRRLRGRGRGIG